MRIFTFLLLWFCFLCPPLGAQKVELVQPYDVVSDYTEEISTVTKEKVKRLAEELHFITSVNMKVVVIRQLQSMVDAATYARQLYDRADIGQEKEGLAHGVLLLISLLDRQVKIVVGKEVEKVLPFEMRDKFEWNVIASLSKGQFSEAVEVGAGLISYQILRYWPREGPGLQVDWQKASLPLFLLFIIAVALTLVVGGGFIMAFSILVGGLFGYIFLDTLGMVFGGALGFFINYGRNEKRIKKEIEEGKKAVEEVKTEGKKE